MGKRRRYRWRFLALSLFLVFWLISLRHLEVIPPVYEDEPWQASTGWKLATDGVFGSDLFAGLNGMERRYFGYMPVHPLLLALIFKGAGVGLFQARFETVCLGLLVMALVYSLAVRLFKRPAVGVVALTLLLKVRFTGRTPSQISGIVLLDVARIARYDIAVPVFGLLSLHAYLWARGRGSGWGHLLAGLLVGLAGLSHLYGLFWLPVLLVLHVWDARRQGGEQKRPARHGKKRGYRGLLFLLLGLALPWVLYGLYVLGDLQGWCAQTAGYAARFRLLDPGWYLSNLLREYRRYGPGLGPMRPAVLLRLGFWGALLALPLSLVALSWRALRGDQNARVLAVPALLLPLLFALLIYLKLSNYLVAMVPLWAIVAAWGGGSAWEWLADKPFRMEGRVALGVLLLGVVTEGSARVLFMQQTAAKATPYASYIGKIQAHIPPGARVLGLHNYWFGLEDYDYRSFVVPLQSLFAVGESGHSSFEGTLDRVAPDVILIDRRMRAFLEDHDQAQAGLEAWLVRRQAQLADRIRDPTYGTMEVWLVPPEKTPAGEQ